MSRCLSIHVFDTSGVDLLKGSELVDVNPAQTFYDVLSGLPGQVSDRDLQSVRLREYGEQPDAQSTKISGNMLNKTVAQLDAALQQQRKPRPSVACLKVSMSEFAPPAPQPRVQNAFAVLNSAGRAAYSRSQLVSKEVVESWYKDTDKGRLALALQARLHSLCKLVCNS